MKLSQILKYAGIAIGALAALKIIYAEIEVIKEHYAALIVMAVGCAVYFAGVWEAKHEAAVNAASAVTGTSRPTPAPATTSGS